MPALPSLLDDEVAATSASPGLLKEGAVLLQGRFRVKQLLGAGGMGEVYLAEQLSLHRDVALKVLRPAISTQPGMAERFRREALILSAVDHPGVVRIIDFGEDGGLSCLVMELVDGQTLDIALRNGEFSVSLIERVLLQLAEGLAAVHAHGIVHRDFKPHNIILCSAPNGEQARLLDFGIARLAESSSPALTIAGLTIGTPEYLSPEQALGTPVDHRSDIYSWGVVAYQLLTGRLPFSGPTPQDFLVQHATGTPAPISGHARGNELSRELCDLIMRCLAKDPARRPTLTQISQALRGIASVERPIALDKLLRIRSGAAGARRDLWAKFKAARPRTKAVLVCVLAAIALLVAWRKSRHATAAETVRQFLRQGRNEAALDYLEKLARQGKQTSAEVRMLHAVALHGADRHTEEWSLAQDIEGPWTHFEPSLLVAASEDYGRNEKKSAPKEILSRFPQKERNTELIRVAQGDPGSAAQWGAVRYLDQTGFDGDVTTLYLASLKSPDCRIRGLAATRLGELGDPKALAGLESLRNTPKKRSLIFEQDCGQNEATVAMKKLRKRPEK